MLLLLVLLLVVVKEQKTKHKKQKKSIFCDGNAGSNLTTVKLFIDSLFFSTQERKLDVMQLFV